jgi:hypothetical protein
MSLTKTWKAPLDLLEQETWTVVQGFYVFQGYFRTEEYEAYDIVEKLFPDKTEEELEQIREDELRPLVDYRSKPRKIVDKLRKLILKRDIPELRAMDYDDTQRGRMWTVYYSIATGEKLKGPQEEIDFAVGDRLHRLWSNSKHDETQRTHRAEHFFDEKWTKVYFIQWARRHKIELPWLEDAISEGWIPQQEDELLHSRGLLIPSKPGDEEESFEPWELNPRERNRDYSLQLYRALEAYKLKGKPIPDAAEVLRHWDRNGQTGISDITPNSFCFYYSNQPGKKSEPVPLTKLQKRINRAIKK